MKYIADFEYIVSHRVNLFTAVLLPHSNGKFPTVVMRSPYVDNYENSDEADIAIEYVIKILN